MTHGYHSYNVCVCTVWWCNNCTVLGTPKKAAKKNKGGGGETFKKGHLQKQRNLCIVFFPPFRLSPPTDDKVQQHYASWRPLCTVSPFTKKCTITDMVVLGRERCISILGTATLK